MRRTIWLILVCCVATSFGWAADKTPAANFVTLSVVDDYTGQAITGGEVLNYQTVEITAGANNNGSAQCYEYIMTVAGKPGQNDAFYSYQFLPPQLVSPGGETAFGFTIGPMPENEKATITVSAMCTGVKIAGGAVLTFYNLYQP